MTQTPEKQCSYSGLHQPHTFGGRPMQMCDGVGGDTVVPCDACGMPRTYWRHVHSGGMFCDDPKD